MSDHGDASPRSPVSSPGSSPLAPVSPRSPRSPHSPRSPRSSNADLYAPESPAGEAQDLYKDDEAPSSPPASPPASRGASPSAGSKSPSPVKTSKVIIDSDDSDGEGASNKRPALIDSDASDTEVKKKKTVFDSDESDQEDSSKKEVNRRDLFGDDSDDDDEDRPKKNDDDLDELVKGEQEVEEQTETRPVYDSDDDDGPRRGGRGGFEWDFDKMLAEKKAERKRKTRRGGKDGGIDIINDDDGVISRLTERMKHAAKSDRNANVERKPAFQKIKMLPEVKAAMLRAGIVEVLIENGFMSALSEWLAPLPDKCLPALDIRINILKLLHNPRFWKLDRSTLKQSGLGKAVMMLYKHPNETKENKAIANKLIGEWARPIYHLDTDYSTVSRHEREERDYARMPEKRKKKLHSQEEEPEDEKAPKRPRIRDAERLGPTKSLDLKPGDKGYVNRARVPKPSTRDYVIRPEWKVAGEFKGEKKASGSTRYDQTLRDFQDRTKKSKTNRLMKVSLEGRNMGI
uniref:IWS1-like protein n=1 Tax=Caenorhabditis tropicalis TaxID=1561998 RepID=A0A1I7UNK3_9PELO